MTQTHRILEHMKRGNGITGLEALDLYGCFRLPARIADIKAMGYKVASNMVTINGKRIARYTLEGA